MVQKATFWIRYTKYSEQESIGKEKCLLVSSRVGPWQGGAVRARSILLSAGPPSVIWCRASRSPALSSPPSFLSQLYAPLLILSTISHWKSNSCFVDKWEIRVAPTAVVGVKCSEWDRCFSRATAALRDGGAGVPNRISEHFKQTQEAFP